MKFTYTNYKGEIDQRDIDVISIDFLTKPGFGYEPGWFLTGRDRNRNGDIRSFRMDSRMVPLAEDMAARRAEGLASMAYPMHENHDVRDAVRGIEDAIKSQVDDAGKHHRGE